MRATAQPAHIHLPEPPNDRGPLAPGPGILPFAYLLAAEERQQLPTALSEMLQHIAKLPPEEVLTISHSIGRGVHTYGTTEQPRITQIQDRQGSPRIYNQAQVHGAGILIVPRMLLLRNVTFQWEGIVLVLDDGDLCATGPRVCGQILGAIIVQDNSALDRKLDLDLVTGSSACTPLSESYSCEAVSRALFLLQRTLSWTEQFDA